VSTLGIHDATVSITVSPDMGSVDMCVRMESDYKHIAEVSEKISEVIHLHSGAADFFTAIGQAIYELDER